MRLATGKNWARRCGWATIAVVLCLGTIPAMGQDAGDPPEIPCGQTPTEAQTPAEAGYVPMTAQERWHAYLHDNFTGVGALAGFFGAAALGQLGREPREWGLGAEGYWHRVGNHMGRAAIRGSIQSGLAAAMGYDTRYHRMGGHHGLTRAGHALRRTLVTQNAEGHSVFDLPGVAGIYGGDMLAMYWHPHRYTPLGQGLRGGNFGLGFQAAGNLVKEFGPDLKQLWHK